MSSPTSVRLGVLLLTALARPPCEVGTNDKLNVFGISYKVFNVVRDSNPTEAWSAGAASTAGGYQCD